MFFLPEISFIPPCEHITSDTHRSHVQIITENLFSPYLIVQVKVVSPKHRLIKVDSQEFGRCKVPLSPVTIQEEPVRTVSYLCFP